MTNEELLNLALDSELSPEARNSLDSELSSRGIVASSSPKFIGVFLRKTGHPFRSGPASYSGPYLQSTVRLSNDTVCVPLALIVKCSVSCTR